MTGPIIDSGGAAATLKTDKQYQYSCLLSFTCLSLSLQTWLKTPGGATLLASQQLIVLLPTRVLENPVLFY